MLLEVARGGAIGFETSPRGCRRAAAVAGSGGKAVVRVPPGRVVLEKRSRIGVTSIPLAEFSTAIVAQRPELSGGRDETGPTRWQRNGKGVKPTVCRDRASSSVALRPPPSGANWRTPSSHSGSFRSRRIHRPRTAHPSLAASCR